MEYSDDGDNNFTENNNTNSNINNNRGSLFSTMKEKVGSSIGYHGSGMENWHNIIRCGLDVRFQKDTYIFLKIISFFFISLNYALILLLTIFGIGIYLSADPNVAFSFKKPGIIFNFY